MAFPDDLLSRALKELAGPKPHSFPTEVTDLVSGPNKLQVLDVSSQKEFNERQSDR